MKKILIVATVERHLLTFHLPTIKMIAEKCRVDSACSLADNKIKDDVNKSYNISFSRKPFSLRNIKAFFQLKKLIKSEKYDLIYTHVPVSSVLVRMANLFSRNRSKVVYLAHGFNFHEKGSKAMWIIFYPIEKFLSRFTEHIVTINREDYNLAKSKFKMEKIDQISGMGVDENQFQKPSIEEKAKLRLQYNYSDLDFILIYSGEFSKRKNQMYALELISLLSKMDKCYKLILPGSGKMNEELSQKVEELGIKEEVYFPGYVSRDEIKKMISFSDIGFSSSRTEGLGIHLIEYMMCGLPIIASNLHGHKELIEENYNGYLYEFDDIMLLRDKVHKLKNDTELYNVMSKQSLDMSKNFSVDKSTNEIMEILNEYIV